MTVPGRSPDWARRMLNPVDTCRPTRASTPSRAQPRWPRSAANHGSAPAVRESPTTNICLEPLKPGTWPPSPELPLEPKSPLDPLDPKSPLDPLDPKSPLDPLAPVPAAARVTVWTLGPATTAGTTRPSTNTATPTMNPPTTRARRAVQRFTRGGKGAFPSPVGRSRAAANQVGRRS